MYGYTNFKSWGSVKAEKHEIAFDAVSCIFGNENHIMDCNTIENLGYCANNMVVTLECE